MFKKLGKKALPIIMATMLVASMTAVSVSATEVATEESTVGVASEASATNVFLDPSTGVKLESADIDLESDNVYTASSMGTYDFIATNLCEIMYNIEVYAEDYSDVDFTNTSVTVSLPCEVADCYVAFVDYATGKPVQVEAEYIDGNYQLQMPGNGCYYICSYPLAEGEGELVEQTLVDETTGVSVTGMIPTDSQLVVVDLMAVLNELITVMEDMGSEYEGADVTVNEEALAMLESIDCYMAYVVRNLDIAKTEGELTVAMPNDTEGYEVRYIHDVPDDSELGDVILSATETIEQELMDPTMTDEELAQQINTLIDSIMPVIASEYANGEYTVKNENMGIFTIVPVGAVYATADDVKLMREEYKANMEESTEAPTDASTEAATEAPTQVATEVSTKAPTQASTQTATNATTSTTQGKGTAKTGESRNIPMLLAVLGTATATAFALSKRFAK